MGKLFHRVISGLKSLIKKIKPKKGGNKSIVKSIKPEKKENKSIRKAAPHLKRTAGGILRLFQNLKLWDSMLKKLVISFLLLIFLPLVIVVIMTSVNINRSTRNQFISSTQQVLQQNTNYVDYIIKTAQNTSMQILTDTVMVNKLTAGYTTNDDRYRTAFDIKQQLQRILVSNSSLDSIFIINPDGISAGAPGNPEFKDGAQAMKEKEWYKKAYELDSQGFWSFQDIVKDFSSDRTEKVLSYTRLFKDSTSGKQAGVLVINIGSGALQNALAKVKLGNGGYMFIVDSSGCIISHTDSSMLGIDVSKENYIQKALGGEGSFSYKDSKTGVNMYAVCSTSESTGWRYVAAVPSKNLTASADSLILWLIIISILCLGAALAVSIRISMTIAKPLKEVVSVMSQVENGDLTASIKHTSNDEFGLLSSNFNRMIANLRQLVELVKGTVQETYEASGMIGQSSSQLAASMAEVSGVIEDIASGAGNQARQASNGTETIESFGAGIESVVSYSGEVRDASNEARDRANLGMNAVAVLRDKSSESMEIITKVSEIISELSRNTGEIEDILQSITRISRQTNLLSLNAAIEAARAGEAGKGFAVVAGEVRKLAEESKQAAENISSIIRNVNIRTRDAVDISKSTVQMLEGQVGYINQTIGAFDNIKNSINVVGSKLENLNQSLADVNRNKNVVVESMEEIAAISEETAASTQQISASTQQQAASVEQLSSMAGDLESISAKLKQLIDKFQI
jgi:methyl-accepting chemotaxis protein